MYVCLSSGECNKVINVDCLSFVTAFSRKKYTGAPDQCGKANMQSNVILAHISGRHRLPWTRMAKSDSRCGSPILSLKDTPLGSHLSFFLGSHTIRMWLTSYSQQAMSKHFPKCTDGLRASILCNNFDEWGCVCTHVQLCD